VSEKSMPFLDHLEELRKRILVSLLAILIVDSVALIFSDTILKIICTTDEHVVLYQMPFLLVNDYATTPNH